MADESTTNGFRALALMGCVAIILVIVVPFALGYYFLREFTRTANVAPPAGFSLPTTSTRPMIGGLGSVCGGRARLPCQPGLACSTDASPTPDAGVCVSVTSTTPAPASSTPSLNISGACDLTLPACAPAYACIPQQTGAACQKVSDVAQKIPRILSVKLDGMSPTDGVYQALAGTRVTVVVQAMDTVSATYHFGHGASGVLKKSAGGSFSATFTIADHLQDDFVVVASGPSGSSSVWMRVASVQ